MASIEKSEHPFVIRESPGRRGMGAFAIRQIAQGERILFEQPLFIQNRVRSAAYVAAALSAKTQDEKKEYASLFNCHSTRKVQPLMGIFNTNALPCGVNDGSLGIHASLAGIFLKACRFNSSCTPNSNNRWNPGSTEARNMGYA